jgi:hypothetical protein
MFYGLFVAKMVIAIRFVGCRRRSTPACVLSPLLDLPPGIALYRSRYAAVGAQSVEFKEVPVDIKPGLVKQSLLQIGQSASGEIHNLAAARTHQMMMMIRWPSHHVTAAPIWRMYTAHQVQTVKQA